VIYFYAALAGIGLYALEYLFWWLWEKRSGRKVKTQTNADGCDVRAAVQQVKDRGDAK
jgi:hypothetical protein